MCLEKLIEFAGNSMKGSFDESILHQLKLIGICARLVMWKLDHSPSVEWPDGVSFEEVSEVVT